MLKNDEQRFGSVSKILHWLMAILIIAMITVGIYMTGLDREDPVREQLTGIHKATGVIVLILALLRIAWIVYTPGPALPAALKAWEKRLTKIVAVLMYALMAFIPVSGIIMTDLADSPPSVLGLATLPDLMEGNRDMAGTVAEVHEIMAFVLLVLIVLHLLGTVKHRFIDKADVDVLRRIV